MAESFCMCRNRNDACSSQLQLSSNRSCRRVFDSVFYRFYFCFMAISSFGMCNGYYSKVKNGRINWTDSYRRRYMKVLPFFSVLVLIDIIVHHQSISIIEAVPNLTLSTGFFPNKIEQIGVGWFLGLVFVFYAVFPLFCSMLITKKSGWLFFFISLLLSAVVKNFYGVGRTNIVYSLPFFLIGGMIYLYRDRIQNYSRTYFCLVALLVSICIYYMWGSNTYTCLLVTTVLLLFAIRCKCECPKLISFFSGISMEIYLSHMVVFRLVEKINMNHFTSNIWIQYCITVILVIVGTVCFSAGIKNCLDYLMNRLERNNESIND